MTTLSAGASRASGLDRRTRLLRALAREPVDRPPVICTGGSMSAVPAEVVARSEFSLPAAHLDPIAMAGLALAAARITGFESVGVPLCTTVEAEVFGAEINLGDEVTEARIVREPFPAVRDVPRIDLEERLRNGRAAVSIEAVRQLATISGDLPIIANLMGPVSIAASVVQPAMLFRELRTEPDKALELIEHINEFLATWARDLIRAGADVIAIHEDTGTPALVGPQVFERITLPNLARLTREIRASGALTLLHMCGKLGGTECHLSQLECEGFIPDSSISVRQLSKAQPHLAMVGNISTFLLHQGSPEQISRLAARHVEDGICAVSPACGMSSATPLVNIIALTHAVTH